MSCLWTCQSLLFVAHLLQRSASFTPVVSLECNSTEGIVAGEAATLNCTIRRPNCAVESYSWTDTRDKIPCNNDGLMGYTCDSDNVTYVSLTIRNVTMVENYTIVILTDCGRAESHIELQVLQNSEQQNSNSRRGIVESPPQAEQITGLHVTFMLISAIFVALFCILCFLFRANKVKKITECFKNSEEGAEKSGTLEDTLIAEKNCEICV